MKIPTIHLTGTALDSAVATALGLLVAGEIPTPIDTGNGQVFPFKPRLRLHDDLIEGVPDFCMRLCPTFSASWAQAGPLIEQARISVWVDGATWKSAPEAWLSADPDSAAFYDMPDAVSGPTPLTAAMRCFVQLKLGEAVEVPDTLI